MPAINCLFMVILTLIAGAVLYAVFLGLWIAAMFLFRVKRKWLWAVVSLPVFMVLFAGGIVAMLLWQPSPQSVFEQEFGFPPPPGVTDLHSRVDGWADAYSAYLRFHATPDAFQQIAHTPHLHLTQAPEDADLPEVLRDDLASHTGRPLLHYLSQDTTHGFANEYRHLVYDPSTGIAYYDWEGID